jgi:hypothetical protein
MTVETDLLPCGQCGMPCYAGEYHPFAACLMFKACLNSETVRANLASIQAEVEALRELCGMAYQLAGVHNAPERWLNALSNAAAGKPFSTDGLLPYWPQSVCEAEARADKLRAEAAEWKRVAAAQAELHGEAEDRADKLRAEVKRLQEIVRPKREDECLTLDHWRMRAYALEESWSRCSRACAVEQTKREQAEAHIKRLEEALREAITMLLSDYPETAKRLRAVLRDQEEAMKALDTA